MGEVFKLFGTIGVDNSEANKALDEIEKKGQGTANKMTGFFSKLSGKIGQSFSNIGKKIDVSGIHNTFNTLGGKINSTLVKSIQTGAKMMAIGGTAAMAAAGATLVKGMNLAGELEQNMGGSEAVFGKYAKSMQQTGIEAYSKMGLSQSDFLAGANQMGSLYQGVGFSVKDSMTMTSDAMQRAADVASIMGIDIDAAMEAVGGMAKGNFTMMDNLGVAINDTAIGNYALAKGIDKSTAKMTTQEKVGLATQMFMEKTAQYAGNYAKENDTLAGSLQTAKAALSNFMSGASTIDDALAAGLNFAKVAGRTAKELAPKLFEGILKAVQTLIPQIPSLLSSLAENIASVLARLFGDEAREAFGVLVDVITETVAKLKAAFDFIVEYKDMFTPIAVGIATVMGLLSAYNAVMTVSKGIQTAYNAVIGVAKGIQAAWAVVTGTATTQQLALNAAMTVNPIAIIVMAIVGLVAALVYFFTKTETGIAIWKKFTSFLVDAWNMVKDKAIEIWSAISEFMITLWQNIVTIFSSVWENIKNVFMTAVEFVKNIVTVGFMLVQSIIEGVMLFIKTAIEFYWNMIKFVIQTALDLIGALIAFVWSHIGDTIMAALTFIQGIVTTAWEFIKTVTSTIFEAVKAVVLAVWNAIKTTLQTVLNAILSVVTSAWNSIKAVTTTVFNAVKTVATNVWNAIKSTIQTVVNVIKNVVTAVWNAIKSATTTAFNAIKSVATSVWNGIKSAIQSAVNAIKSVVTSVWNGIKSTTSSVFNSIKSTATSVWNGVKNAITTPIEAAKNKVKSIVDAIKGFFSGMKLRIPKISLPPLPRFSLTGSFSLKPPSVPKLSVSWNALGGIFSRPTIFDTAAGLQGVGEAGPEAILPLTRDVLGGIGQGIASTMGYSEDLIVAKLDELINRLEILFGQFHDMQIVMDSGELVGAIKKEIDRQLGRSSDNKGRGRAD